MFPKRLRRTVIAALAASAVAVSAAQAEPFFDDLLLQSRGFGIEMVGARLHAIAQFDPVPVELAEASEAFFDKDLPRFIGTLRDASPFVANGLVEALEAVHEGVEDGDVGIMTLAFAQVWQSIAYDILVPPAMRTPAYWGGIAADLLLVDGGVGEAMEEAIADDEIWGYPAGWAALQRIEWIWSEVAGLANEEEASFGRQYLDMLHELLPTAQIPDSFPPNPEEAEAPAQSMVGVFESVVDASLYTGRDLGRLATHLADLVAPACELYAAGEAELALETSSAVRQHYRKHLRRLLDLIAPEVHEVAGGILDELVADEDERPADLGGACRDLYDALIDARGSLGG